MNIGFDARLYQKGLGLGRYVEQLLLQYDHMNLGKNTMTVFLSADGMKQFVPRNPAIKTVLAPYHWYTAAEQMSFPGLLNRSHCDVVHFPHFNVPVWYKKPYVVTIHDLILLKMPRSARIAATTRLPLIYDLKYKAYQYVLNTATKHARHIIVPTDYVKKDMIETLHCAPEKITRIYEAAMDIKPTMTSNPPAVAGPYVLYVGNAYPHKNIDLLLALGNRLEQEASDIRIVLVGQDDYFSRKLIAIVKEQGLGTRIQHRGYVPDEVLTNLYVNALAYVFPSYEEGFGLPGLEAMSYGLPVIASSASCLPEVYNDAALYASPDSVEMWLEMINTIRYDTALRDDLIRKGLKRVSQFSWKTTAQETMHILTTL